MLGRSSVIFLAKFQVLSAQETQLLDTMLYVVGQDACVWFGAYTGTTLLPRRDTAYRAVAVYSHMNVSLHNINNHCIPPFLVGLLHHGDYRSLGLTVTATQVNYPFIDSHAMQCESM